MQFPPVYRHPKKTELSGIHRPYSNAIEGEKQITCTLEQGIEGKIPVPVGYAVSVTTNTIDEI